MESVPVSVTETQESTTDVAMVQSAKADVAGLTEEDETGINYADGETGGLVAVDLGTYKLYEDDGGLAHTNGLYYFDKRYYDADVIICLPVLKSHQMAARSPW
jgi:hypothetical protein